MRHDILILHKLCIAKPRDDIKWQNCRIFMQNNYQVASKDIVVLNFFIDLFISKLKIFFINNFVENKVCQDNNFFFFGLINNLLFRHRLVMRL